jgi:hypothetical protein
MVCAQLLLVIAGVSQHFALKRLSTPLNPRRWPPFFFVVFFIAQMLAVEGCFYQGHRSIVAYWLLAASCIVSAVLASIPISTIIRSRGAKSAEKRH